MAKNKKSSLNPIVKSIYPKQIETFREPSWELDNLSRNSPEPYCFNGIVAFKRYKITAEIIEEPIEVYQERLEALWANCDNHHHWLPLQAAASSIGYTFKSERGSQRKNKY